jgi:hypothetical protein
LRSAIIGVSVSAVALLAVWLIVGPFADPTDLNELPEPTIALPVAPVAEPPEPAMPLPAPDAAITLTSGGISEPLIAASFAPDALLNVDLALPISIPESGPLWARVVAAGREPLMLDGLVRGADRNTVRVEVPAGWLVPGDYLVEIKTPERTHLPLRRFAFSVK